jgi:hypothetical protein
LCIVHLVRAALKYVTTEDSKAVAADLKTIYQSATVEEAETALEKFAEVWGAKYPTIVKQWRLKWLDLIHAVRVPAGDPQGDLHDERDRVGQQRDPQVHPQPQAVPQRGVRVKTGVHGNSRGIEALVVAHTGLEGGPKSLRHPVRRSLARAKQKRLIRLKRISFGEVQGF